MLEDGTENGGARSKKKNERKDGEKSLEFQKMILGVSYLCLMSRKSGH